MSKEYTIQGLKKSSTWRDAYGEYTSYALALKEFGEPVKLNKSMPIDKEPVAGDRIYGQLIQEDVNGKTYYRLLPKPRPAEDKALLEARAEWAIGQAVSIYCSNDTSREAYENIEREAKHFYNMVNKVIEG